jgi:putative inorganic carbon (HCO3(-)) transporter
MTDTRPNRHPQSPNQQGAAAWLDPLSLASLVLMAPLFLFPASLGPWLGLILAWLIALWRWIVRGRPPLAILDIPLHYLAFMALLGLAISIDRSLSWPRFWSLVYALIVFTTLRRALRPGRDAPWIALALALAGLGLAGISLVGTDWSQVRLIDLPWLYDRLPVLIRGLPGSGVPRASDLFNPRWVGISLSVLAPLYLALLGWRERPWLVVLIAMIFLVSVSTLLLTQSIQGVLGLLVGCFIVLLFVSRRFWLLLPLGLLSCAALLAWIGPQRLASVLLSINHPAGIAVVLRLDIWSRALAMLHDLPFTGIGLNVFPPVQSYFYTGYLIGPEPHAHNLYLQTALDLGLPGLVAFLWFLTLWALYALRRLRQNHLQVPPAAPPADPALVQGDRLLLIGALAGITSYLAHGFIDAMMLGAKPSFLVWALLGVGAALAPPPPLPTARRSLRLALAWLAMPIVFALFALLYPTRLPLNLAAIQAQRCMYPFPPTRSLNPACLSIPRVILQAALRLDPKQGQAHLLLARIASLQGDYPAALAHYEQRLSLDMQHPLVYNPAQRMLHWLAPQAPFDPAAELLKVYQAWVTRFPERAEGYLLRSLVVSQYQHDPARGQALVQAGIKANPQPLELLLVSLHAR